MGPMDGVTVVEMGLWVAGPSCGGILADWGAEVTKIEPLAGDPFRSLEWVYGEGVNPPFELDNRGKRSIADLAAYNHAHMLQCPCACVRVHVRLCVSVRTCMCARMATGMQTQREVCKA